MCIADTRRFGVREYMKNGVCLVETPDLLPGKLRSGWDPWCALNRWLWLRKNFDFDLIHAFETRPATIHPLQLMLWKKKIPLVIDWWGRGGLVVEHRPRWYQILFGGLETFYEEHFRTVADATTVICHALGERAVGLGVPESTIFRVPIGSSTDVFSVQNSKIHRPQFGIPDGAFVLVFSTLDAALDADLVFRSIAVLKQKHPETLLVMTGNQRDRLMKMADQAGIAEHFIHLGFVPDEDFPKTLACADVFLLPLRDKVANRGRWPCKIGDYLACGRPVISNPTGEMKILLSEERIGLLANETPEGFAQTIELLIENPSLRAELGAEARRVAETRLAWNGIIEGLERAYEQACGPPVLKW
jgi:glycosyltransferase involved in cell wall biosynthesis